MEYERVVFTRHAIQRLFERGLNKDDVLEVIKSRDIIAEYQDDEPFPSYLILGFIEGKPLHVVVAEDTESHICYVVTVYIPDPGLWDSVFKGRSRS